MATLVHRCRFVEWTPEAIISMDMSPAGTRPFLAVVRNNGDLELYDASQNWSQRRIPVGGAIGRAIQSVLWIPPKSLPDVSLCGNNHRDWNIDEAHVSRWEEAKSVPVGRLFTAGLDGMIVEWDVEKLCPKRVMTVDGAGGFWCMTSSPDGTLLTVGCEDSTIRIVSVRKFTVVKTLLCPPVGQLLSIAWCGQDQQLLAVGTSVSTVLIWNHEQGKLSCKVNLEKRGEEETLVWTMRFAGLQLITGDSTGAVSVLAARSGTVTSSARVHKSQVLTIAMNHGESAFYASSAAGLTVEFQKYTEREVYHKWKPSQRRTNHTHDVRASVCAIVPCAGYGLRATRKTGYHEILVSGGVDGSLVLHDPTISSRKEPRRLSRLPQHPICHIAKKGRIIAALSGCSTIRFWKVIGADDKTQKLAQASHAVSLGKLSAPPARQLLQINVPGGEAVSHFDISNDGSLFAYTTRSTVRLFRLKIKAAIGGFDPVEDVDIIKVALPDQATSHGSPSLVKFSPDNRSVVLSFVNQRGQTWLVHYSIDDSNQVAEQQAVKLPCTASLNMGCWEGNTLAIHDLANNVRFVDMATLTIRSSSPTLPSWVQTMHLLTEDELVLVTAEKHIYLVKVADGRMTPHTSFPSRWTRNQRVISGITCVPGTEQKPYLRLWSDRSIIKAELDKALPTQTQDAALRKARRQVSKLKDNVESKTPLQTEINELEQALASNLTENRDFSLILGLEFITPEEAIVVERPEDALIASLPPAERRRKFGGF